MGRITRRWAGFEAFTVLGFAAMLIISNVGLEPPLNISWLFRLLLDSFGDLRYIESLITALATDALLLGSLIVGASLSRAREPAEIHLFPPSG